MRITRKDIEEQLRRDREAIAAMSPGEREHLERVAARIRKPSHVNFSDPEVL